MADKIGYLCEMVILEGKMKTEHEQRLKKKSTDDTHNVLKVMYFSSSFLDIILLLKTKGLIIDLFL